MWLAAASAATFVVAVLLFDTNAFPQKITSPPFTVESEIVRHDEGSIVHSGPTALLVTSYNQDGSEVILSWSSHNKMFHKAVFRTELALRGFIGKITRRFLLTPEQIARREQEAVVYPAMIGESWSLGQRADLIQSGCTAQKNVVGQEVILNYPTKAIQHNIGADRILTLWMAPDLSCFALRARIEVQQPDGTLKLISEKKAIRVTLNR